MAFEKFHFGDFTGFGTPKLWSKQGMDSGDTDTNLPLFSSTETSENQVRADLQLLFSQLKEGLNKILGHVVSAIDQSRKSESLLVSEKAVVDYMTALGNGDMSHAVYDSDEAVKDAGGIKAFVNSSAGAAITTHANNTTIHTSAAEKATWNSKANGTHSHAVSDVTGLQTALDGKAASGHTHNTIGNNLSVTGNLSATGTISGNAMIADKMTGLDTDQITQDSSAANKKYVDDSVSGAVAGLSTTSYGVRTVQKSSTLPDDSDKRVDFQKDHKLIVFGVSNSGLWSFTVIPIEFFKERDDSGYIYYTLAIRSKDGYYTVFAQYADGGEHGHGILRFRRPNESTSSSIIVSVWGI